MADIAVLDDDLAGGIRGLPHVLGRGRSVSVTVVLLLAATVTLSFGPGHPGWWAVVVLVKSKLLEMAFSVK